jgi:predicted secreted protein
MSRATIVMPSSAQATVTACGDVVEVELAENPTTGYRWTVTSLPHNLVEVERSEFQPSQPTTPGAAGHRYFRFRVQGRGRGVIEFALIRPWESGNPVDRLGVRIEA